MKSIRYILIAFTIFSSHISFAQKKSTNQSIPDKVLIHQVYFWLKPGLSNEQIAKFENGVKSLLKIKTIKYGDVGKPAATALRPVIDASYSYSLTVFFDDVAGHDAYQIDPIHEQFLKECKDLWEKVQVYDSFTAK